MDRSFKETERFHSAKLHAGVYILSYCIVLSCVRFNAICHGVLCVLFYSNCLLYLILNSSSFSYLVSYIFPFLFVPAYFCCFVVLFVDDRGYHLLRAFHLFIFER